MKTVTWVLMIMVFALLIAATVLAAIITGYTSVASGGTQLTQDEINTTYALSVVTTVLCGIAVVILVIYLIWWWAKTRNVVWPDDAGYNEAKALKKRKHQQKMMQPQTPQMSMSPRQSPQMQGNMYEPGRMSMGTGAAMNQSMY